MLGKNPIMRIHRHFKTSFASLDFSFQTQWRGITVIDFSTKSTITLGRSISNFHHFIGRHKISRNQGKLRGKARGFLLVISIYAQGNKILNSVRLCTRRRGRVKFQTFFHTYEMDGPQKLVSESLLSISVIAHQPCSHLKFSNIYLDLSINVTCKRVQHAEFMKKLQLFASR